jgi:hypothetical protein
MLDMGWQTWYNNFSKIKSDSIYEYQCLFLKIQEFLGAGEKKVVDVFVWAW